MPNEPIWIPEDHVIWINQEEVQRTEEPHFLRDQGLLSSACARPQQFWAYDEEDDIINLAVCLLFGIARNHPFEQGNKRTAFTSSLTFIEANDHISRIPDQLRFAEAVLAVLRGRMTEVGFAAMLRPHITRRRRVWTRGRLTLRRER